MVKRRNRMTFPAHWPEMQQAAEDTNFRTLVDGIHDDPAGRGPVPAMSPLMSKPAPTDDLDMAFTPQEVAKRAPETGLNSAQDALDQPGGVRLTPRPVQILQSGVDSVPRNPYRDPDPRVKPIVDDAKRTIQNAADASNAPPQELGMNTAEDWTRQPAPSPLAGKPAQGGYNPELGDTSENMPPDLPGAGRPEVADPYGEDGDAATQKFDYGRVTANQLPKASAGEAPPGGDKWLAGARGIGSILMSAGGKSRQGMQAGLDAYEDYQGQERERRDYTARQAQLDAQNAAQQNSENRYAEQANYGRARDEDAASRQSAQDARQGLLDKERAGDRAYERDPARQAEAEAAYRKRKEIDREFARPRGGAGGGRRNAVAQFDAARERLIAIRGGADKLTQEDNAAIKYAAGDLRDPGGTLNKYADQTGKNSRQDEARNVTRGDKQAKAATEIQAADDGLARLEQAIQRKIDQGETTLPNTAPLAGAARAVGGALKQATPGADFKPPARRPNETDDEYNEREDVKRHRASSWGPSGYSEDDSTINSFGQLYARGLYYDTTQNSANLKSEADVADATVRNNGTLAAMRDQVREMRRRLAARRQSGNFIVRDENGEVAGPSAPQGGYSDPDDIQP